MEFEGSRLGMENSLPMCIHEEMELSTHRYPAIAGAREVERPFGGQRRVDNL